MARRTKRSISFAPSLNSFVNFTLGLLNVLLLNSGCFSFANASSKTLKTITYYFFVSTVGTVVEINLFLKHNSRSSNRIIHGLYVTKYMSMLPAQPITQQCQGFSH